MERYIISYPLCLCVCMICAIYVYDQYIDRYIHIHIHMYIYRYIYISANSYDCKAYIINNDRKMILKPCNQSITAISTIMKIIHYMAL